jgi:hypothetical protein
MARGRSFVCTESEKKAAKADQLDEEISAMLAAMRERRNRRREAD